MIPASPSKSGAVRLPVACHRFEVESTVRAAEVLGFLENRNPRQPGLVDFKNQALEEQVVIIEREAILGVVIRGVEYIFGVGVAVFAVSGHGNILPLCRALFLKLPGDQTRQEMPQAVLMHPMG
jgi:hypothetical protein